MQGIYLLLGTNLGNRESNLARAKSLAAKANIEILRESAIYETAAWGIEDQPGFLNQIVAVATTLKPELLLEKLLSIEQEMGRIRERKWGQRLIDLDILYYHNRVIETKDLQVPHPGIPNRRFTLVPLVELAAEEWHPVLQKSQSELLEICPDKLPVKRFYPKDCFGATQNSPEGPRDSFGGFLPQRYPPKESLGPSGRIGMGKTKHF